MASYLPSYSMPKSQKSVSNIYSYECRVGAMAGAKKYFNAALQYCMELEQYDDKVQAQAPK
jgi:hypothetical protein